VADPKEGLQVKKTTVGKKASFMGSLEEDHSSEGIYGIESDEAGTEVGSVSVSPGQKLNS
jgi:hypothetical protein